MCTITGTGTFESRWNVPFATCIEEGASILSPGSLIEIDGKKPTGLVRQQARGQPRERLIDRPETQQCSDVASLEASNPPTLVEPVSPELYRLREENLRLRELLDENG